MTTIESIMADFCHVLNEIFKIKIKKIFFFLSHNYKKILFFLYNKFKKKVFLCF